MLRELCCVCVCEPVSEYSLWLCILTTIMDTLAQYPLNVRECAVVRSSSLVLSIFCSIQCLLSADGWPNLSCGNHWQQPLRTEVYLPTWRRCHPWEDRRYRTAGNFHVVKNFVVFVDRSASAKIQIAASAISIALCIRAPRKCLEPSEAILQNFAPSKIARCLVICSYSRADLYGHLGGV